MASNGNASTRLTRAREIYARMRNLVETPDQIGQVMVIDLESGDFEIGGEGIEASHRLQQRHPGTKPFALRIGYQTVDSFAGMLERN